MRAIRLKDLVETVGIISIVASLIFLAIQVRQAQEVAVSETDAAMLESGLQLKSLVVEHADVWRRGSAGELLPEPEATVFRNLVEAHGDVAFMNYQQARRLGESDIAAVVLHDFSAFLHMNPGARREWLAREEAIIASRRQLVSGEDFSFWRNSIFEDLAKLDSLAF